VTGGRAVGSDAARGAGGAVAVGPTAVAAPSARAAGAGPEPRRAAGDGRLRSSPPGLGAGPAEAVWLLLPGGLRRREPLRVDLHVGLFARCLHEGQAGLVEVWAARRAPDGRRLRPTTSRRDPAYFPAAGDLRALVRLARRHRDRGEEVFAAPLARPRPEPGKGVVAGGRVVWVDLDDPALIAGLGGLALRPHLVVASGGGVHAYWRLAGELPGRELEAANRRLAARLGGDPQASDRGRPMRLPGTVNHKRGAWCRVLLCDLARPGHDPAALLGELPADPHAPPAMAPRTRARPRPAIAARGVELSPPEYFGRLAGVEVPAHGGFVACPLPGHEERTPSCRVFAEADRGFWCFGCGRGGRLYDLQSLLDGGPWGRELRGDAFLAAKQRAHRALGLG
jgi:hypothetical protein